MAPDAADYMLPSHRSGEPAGGMVLDALGLSGVPLLQLPGRCPGELREQTQRTVQRLRDRSQVLRSAQETARTLMEGQLREIQRELRRRGADPEVEAHYAPAGHTDFIV